MLWLFGRNNSWRGGFDICHWTQVVSIDTIVLLDTSIMVCVRRASYKMNFWNCTISSNTSSNSRIRFPRTGWTPPLGTFFYCQGLPKKYYHHDLGETIVDETPTRIRTQQLKVADWTLTYEEQCTKHKLGMCGYSLVCEKKRLHLNGKDLHYLLLSLDGVQRHLCLDLQWLWEESHWS